MAISKIVTNSVDSGVTITSPVINTITSAAATALTLQSAGTTAITVDTSQNVGIGTSSPSTWNGSNLVSYYAGGNNFAGITAINNNTVSGIGGIQFGSDATYVKAAIGLVRQNPNGSGSLVFYNDSNIDAANWSTGDEKMRIDASGRVTTPFQTGFIAKGLAAQTAYTQGQVVVFNSASYNVGSGYNTSNGRFTAPVTGLYSFTYQLYLNPGNGNAPFAFYKNGVMEIFFLQGVTMNGIGLSTLISLSASDYVEVQVRNIAGASATIYGGADHTQFTGYLLG